MRILDRINNNGSKGFDGVSLFIVVFVNGSWVYHRSSHVILENVQEARSLLIHSSGRRFGTFNSAYGSRYHTIASWGIFTETGRRHRGGGLAVVGGGVLPASTVWRRLGHFFVPVFCADITRQLNHDGILLSCVSVGVPWEAACYLVLASELNTMKFPSFCVDDFERIDMICRIRC